MHFEMVGTPHHNGVETYRVAMALKDHGDRYDVKGAFVQFTIRPETVTLVWERDLVDGVTSSWQRVGYRPRGAFSAFVGPRVLKDGTTSDMQEAMVEVWVGVVGKPERLTDYAASFPHLEQMIAELEKSLPA